MIGKLVRCVKCNDLINMTEWDFSPEYIWNNGSIKEIKGDDRETFLHRHKGHEMQELTPVSSLLSDKPYTEPVKTSYFEATNGKERFLIKRWREKIDNPFVYKIIHGRIEITNEKVQVQTEAIKKQMRMEKNFYLSEQRVDNFITTFQKEVGELNPETLEVSAEGDTPLVSYCKLDNDSINRILTKFEHKLEKQEFEQLKDFALRHNQYNDVMTVVVQKKLSIKALR